MHLQSDKRAGIEGRMKTRTCVSKREGKVRYLLRRYLPQLDADGSRIYGATGNEELENSMLSAKKLEWLMNSLLYQIRRKQFALITIST